MINLNKKQKSQFKYFKKNNIIRNDPTTHSKTTALLQLLAKQNGIVTFQDTKKAGIY
ncbi:hypothetical protein [Carnobacterium pleistocenium]|uniref:hypothetical protein n=1 Tax=Carnobacterium pleistocenium TaxID=181073 RepID=UPI001E545916|nr:hypothetical protein [Carnobacterium pleistocenium]